VNGRTKKVEDDVGVPDSLSEFEREIDGVAATKRWVFLDEDALEELTRSGWLASGEEGAATLLGAGANPRGSTGMPAAECTRQARQSAAGHRRTVLDRGRPTVEDFDRVLALLECAEKRMKR
jgi:hypothetical protein